MRIDKPQKAVSDAVSAKAGEFLEALDADFRAFDAHQFLNAGRLFPEKSQKSRIQSTGQEVDEG